MPGRKHPRQPTTQNNKLNQYITSSTDGNRTKTTLVDSKCSYHCENRLQVVSFFWIETKEQAKCTRAKWTPISLLSEALIACSPNLARRGYFVITRSLVLNMLSSKHCIKNIILLLSLWLCPVFYWCPTYTQNLGACNRLQLFCSSSPVPPKSEKYQGLFIYLFYLISFDAQ